MSWWAQKIAQTLNLDDDDDDHTTNLINQNSNNQNPNNQNPNPNAGVKEDLSELTQTLTRQFSLFTSFLAPPPQNSQNSESNHENEPGNATDLAARFRTGIYKLSDNIAKADFTKWGSDLLGIEEDETGIGVNQEIVDFVKDLAAKPHIWLDFPLPDDYVLTVEFDMSDAQQEHALAVERLAPSLAALRMELCPGYMSESCFWMIYFVLLHPHLSEHDAELLSTPETVEARAQLTENQTVTEGYYSGDSSTIPQNKLFFVTPNIQSESIPLEAVSTEPNSSTSNDKFATTDKHPIPSSEVLIVDKSVIEEQPKDKPKDKIFNSGSYKEDENFEDEADDWLKEESSNMGDAATSIPIENDEDVSFSDLEEDDGDASTSYKKVAYGSDSSPKESRDWVQLGRSSTDSTKDINTVSSEQVRALDSESKESSDWLDLEEIDVE